MRRLEATLPKLWRPCLVANGDEEACHTQNRQKHLISLKDALASHRSTRPRAGVGSGRGLPAVFWVSRDLPL